MKKLFLLTAFLISAGPVFAETYDATCYVKNDNLILVNVNRLCSGIVGIPYASDNFSDHQYHLFTGCVKLMRKYDGIE